ncbi:MAG TPA: Gfo/Idh/MocA family oxidoreductase [Limnochordia bacterium]
MKLGMIGLDTSHCPAFTELLNNTENPHHVPGGRVVAAFPGGSQEMAPSRDRVERFTAQLADQYGVKILDSIEAVAAEVDAVFLESVDGRQHREQFARIAPFGKPVFIDKPLATSVDDARAIFELADRYGSPVLPCSSIRFARGIEELGEGRHIIGCEAFGPAPVLPDFPALFWYGIHTAEVLFAKMGTGCREVVARRSENADVVTGRWEDGRIGTLYGYRIAKVSTFGATLFTDGGVAQGTAGSDPPYYALMLPHVLRFFATGEAPIPREETLEIVAFLEAANRSRESGEPVILER